MVDFNGVDEKFVGSIDKVVNMDEWGEFLYIFG